MFIIIIITFFISLFFLYRKKDGDYVKALISIFIFIIEMFLSAIIPDNCANISYVNKITSTYENTQPNDNLTTTEHIHSGDITEKENIIEANCTEYGSYDNVVYCACGEELNRETITVNPLGHNYISETKPPTCTQSGYTIYTCSRCNDTYTNNQIDAFGHDYVNGVCSRCDYVDPYYIETFDGTKIMEVLSNSLVSDSGKFESYLGNESISVFAENRYNCFSFETAVSYNLWNNNIQNAIFNISDLNEITNLNFKIGGETGSSGSMTVEIFLDKTFDENADYTYEIEASAIPIDVSINIDGITSLGIQVTNKSNNINTIVFFDFSDGSN